MKKDHSLIGRIRHTLGREQTSLVFLAAAYFLTGKAGLAFGYQNPSVTVLFPPAGIALGAFLVLGYRVWPVILLAALMLYASVLGPVVAVPILAVANTAEGLFAAYLMNRYAGGRHALQTPRHAMRFAGLTALTSVCCSSMVATVTLSLLGLAPIADANNIWMSWSLGVFGGTVLTAPLVLLFAQGRTDRWKRAQVLEAATVFVCVLAVGLVVFCGVPVELRGYPLEMACLVVLLWPAFRLGRRAASLGLLILLGLATFGTLSGYGPFVSATPTASLMMVVSYMSVMSVLIQALAALAAEYAVAESQLRDMVVTDPMTGLPNYRRLVEVLTEEITRANRTDSTFAVVFCDMDGLKQINDELGHLIGSRAVCRFADTLKACVRDTDTAARYGGDEFVAVLPGSDEEGARAVIDRLTTRLAEDKVKPELATSAGVAVYPRDGSTATTLLSAADRALYAVKAHKASVRRRGVVPIKEWTNAGAR
ncbi:MAG TPA: diguanylate cyclase [Vicinamibacterales bacterium]|nr:diguanylate cyclase [Vicinamibacterales bacterium]